MLHSKPACWHYSIQSQTLGQVKNLSLIFSCDNLTLVKWQFYCIVLERNLEMFIKISFIFILYEFWYSLLKYFNQEVLCTVTRCLTISQKQQRMGRMDSWRHFWILVNFVKFRCGYWLSLKLRNIFFIFVIFTIYLL